MAGASTGVPALKPDDLFVGIDIGTSGCRATAIGSDGVPAATTRFELPAPLRDGRSSIQDPSLWWDGVTRVLDALFEMMTPQRVRAIAVDGTSGTLLLSAPDGTPLTPARMYDDTEAAAQTDDLARCAPASVAAPSLAKLLLMAGVLGSKVPCLALHQADWISGKLSGRFGISDINNALKFGYDADEPCWPDWLACLPLEHAWLPQVVPVGTVLGTVTAELARQTGLRPDTLVCAGTTDSTASVMAAGASAVGDAVTVLGSTMVFKVVTTRPVTDASCGIYSHRYGDRWLAGGASNSGGAVVAHFFTAARLRTLEAEIDPDRPTGLDYYPLLRPGERFPVNDRSLPPRLDPRPDSDATFLQAMLEGMAAIEAAGYRRLEQLGCPRPSRILTIGGGSSNLAWQRIRERVLAIPVAQASHQEASRGAALVAKRGYEERISRPT